jgi:hypothetical protein
MQQVVYMVQTQHREHRKLLMNGQHPLYFLAATMPQYISMTFHHLVNQCSKYADGSYNSMIDDNDSHTPLPLIMFTCTALRHPILKWQRNNHVHPTASKLNLKAGRPDCLYYFNYKNDDGKYIFCCIATGRKLLMLAGIAET